MFSGGILICHKTGECIKIIILTIYVLKYINKIVIINRQNLEDILQPEKVGVNMHLSYY